LGSDPSTGQERAKAPQELPPHHVLLRSRGYRAPACRSTAYRRLAPAAPLDRAAFLVLYRVDSVYRVFFLGTVAFGSRHVILWAPNPTTGQD